jgi:hypothetical protein
VPVRLTENVARVHTCWHQEETNSRVTRLRSGLSSAIRSIHPRSSSAKGEQDEKADDHFIRDGHLQFRIEAFNVFNHTNFLLGDNNINSPSFGIAGGTHPPRNLQLGLKMSY